MIKRTKGLTFHNVGISLGIYVCLIGWVHCFICLVIHIVSARVRDVGRHDVCLDILQGWCIHVPIGNSRVAMFHNILTIRNACYWILMILIPLCLGWGHGKWNCRWQLVLELLWSGPILQGWFGGGWHFFRHSKVLLFLIQMHMTWHNPAWASGPSEILRYFTCSGSPVQDRVFESLRNFQKGRFKCLGSRAVANSHAAG